MVLCVSSYSFTMESMQRINVREKEKCYLCKCETPIYKDEPIEKRYHFIEGAGQLCQECYEHCEWLRFYTSS
jgi:hypothetical protein